MLTFNRIDHFGQVVTSIDDQLRLLQGLFGFTLKQRWQGSEARGARLAVPGRSAIDWEVLSPYSEGSPLMAFLRSPTGPGIHHVALEVPSAAAVAGELRRHGSCATIAEGVVEAPIEPTGNGDGLRFRFFEPQRGDGCRRAPALVEAKSPGRAEGATLGIVAIDHLCHAFPDRDELARFYERVLGMRERWRTPDGEHHDLADLVLDVPGGQMSWEVIQPAGEGSFIGKFLSTRGPSPHHITFEVASWERAMAACQVHGIPTFGDNAGETDGAAWRDAFIHPKHTGGMLVQLFWEAAPGAWVRSDKVPVER